MDKIIEFISKKEVIDIAILLVAAYFVYNIISVVIDKLIDNSKTTFERKKRTTVARLLKNIVKYVVVIIVVLIGLTICGYDIFTLVAGLGIAATILGLALQDTFKDIISGITILLENYYIVGDYVRYNNFTGIVTEFGLKSTKIKAINGEILTIANRNVTEVVNLSQKAATVVISLPIAYEEQPENVEKVINEKLLPEIEKIENVISGTTKFVGIDELSDSSITYLISADCMHETQWATKRAINKIALIILNKNKIKIPYPQVEVHNAKN